jgi:bacillopeptidase F (M6 metalloprotease family)
VIKPVKRLKWVVIPRRALSSNTQVWTHVTYDLTTYQGPTIRLYFNDHQDGYGDLTYMYLDDVSVIVQ